MSDPTLSIVLAKIDSLEKRNASLLDEVKQNDFTLYQLREIVSQSTGQGVITNDEAEEPEAGSFKAQVYAIIKANGGYMLANDIAEKVTPEDNEDITSIRRRVRSSLSNSAKYLKDKDSPNGKVWGLKSWK